MAKQSPSVECCDYQTSQITTITDIHDIKVVFIDPLFGKKITRRKKVKFVNGTTRNLDFLEVQIWDWMDEIYCRKIGYGWKVLNVSDEWNGLGPHLVGEAATAKRILVNERMDKVKKVGREVAAKIRSHFNLGKNGLDHVLDCLHDCS